eukprot:CAMPEP_0202858414 /NCGR_PEP_ID=MMETSP1391-20130828/962_1 /ASSEMBLY_ACC=CAM_ASM_000867 /TAXON_ID=1034604 /ORGANISM="Chlamydomonas leiostraca, Strain SAG 11-49" /LENGTH=229 /DNA_ID=CAMNT_0049537335 /DNA_START=209 /DNA_END=898 /DNA_ORIENTATION=+
MPMMSGAIPSKERKGIARSTADQLYFQLKEFEEFRNPSFNTLYVQTPKPPIFTENKLVAGFVSLVRETWDLVQPVMRLGVPNNSLRDKLPYFREDYSPLPNTVRPRVQKLLKANIQYAEQQAALSAQAAEEWRQMKKARKEAKKSNKPLPVPQQLALLEQTFDRHHHGHGHHGHHGHGHGHGHGHHDPNHVHISPPVFYTHDIPAHIMVPALNLAAYWYLCGLSSIFKQ